MNLAKKSYIIFFAFLLLFCFTACEKELELNIPHHESKIVVEGWIEQGKGAQVLLSMSARAPI